MPGTWLAVQGASELALEADEDAVGAGLFVSLLEVVSGLVHEAGREARPFDFVGRKQVASGPDAPDDFFGRTN